MKFREYLKEDNFNPSVDSDDVFDYIEKNAEAFESFKNEHRGKTVQAKNDEQMFIVHPSTRTGIDNWQVTTFENGKPIGHETREQWDQAIDFIEDDVDWTNPANYQVKDMSRTIAEMFRESTTITRWYHGDISKRTDFCNQNMQRDLQLQEANANGPGIYFTNNADEAYGYASPSGYMYTVDLDTDAGRIITDEDQSEDNRDLLIRLMKIANKLNPEKVYYTISDYMEGAVTEPEDVEEWMFAQVAENYMSDDLLIKDAALISRDFFDSANDWAKSMSKNGIIGYLPEGVKDNQHLIVYDCDIITIIDEKPYKQEEIKEDKQVRIFRAQPLDTTGIRKDDYVTPSVKFAVEHAESNHVYEDEPHVVVSAVVNKDDIREATNPGEYLSNIDVEGDVIYTSKGYEYEGWEEVAHEVRRYLR